MNDMISLIRIHQNSFVYQNVKLQNVRKMRKKIFDRNYDNIT